MITERPLQRPSDLEEDNTSLEDAHEAEAEENDDMIQNVHLTDKDNIIAVLFKLPLSVEMNQVGKWQVKQSKSILNNTLF
jgi:hypothetical protein